MAVWAWVSRPIWWDPFARDPEAQRAFRARLRTRRDALIWTGAGLLLFAVLAGVFRC
jgi:hypothetical protein